MNTTKLKDVNVYFILGSPGSGKTVLSYELKKALNVELETLDDIRLSMSPKLMYDMMDRLSKIRHTKERFIVTGHYSRMFNRIWLLFDTPFPTEEKIAIIFTSAEHEMLDDFHFHIPNRILFKFRKSYFNAITKKRKTRPYLIVTPHNGFRIGWYKDSRASQKLREVAEN